MTQWIDLTALIPGLHKGQWLHVVNSPIDPLVRTLKANGFAMFVLEGSEINDSQSLFRQAKRIFDFPAYFGENWDAWDECLRDFESTLSGPTAIVWQDAHKTFLSDAKTFLEAVIDLYNLALRAGNLNNPRLCQVELFLVGDLEGFRNILDFGKE